MLKALGELEEETGSMGRRYKYERDVRFDPLYSFESEVGPGNFQCMLKIEDYMSAE